MTMQTFRPGSRDRGFTLIDLLVALAIIAILLRIAFPSYQAYIIRSSRQSAQSELVALANMQEKIFLNSSAYATSTTAVTDLYTGQSNGGLGVASGKTKDGRYAFSLAATATTFTLTADPAGTPQASDGTLTINEAGVRTWGTSLKSW
jgi:type IV pilus assembly protein PilE